MRWSCLTVGLILALFFGVARGQENLPEVEIDASGPSESVISGNETAGYGSPLRDETLAPEDLFGGRTGYIHPFFSASGVYTDNLFRTNRNEQSDRYAIIVPGFWLALPARKLRALEINTLNTAPGGLALSRFSTQSERRLQGYALYRADIRKHDRYPDENRVDHRGEGMIKLSLRSGLSLELVDVYERNSDPYGTGGRANQLDTFDANLFNATLISRLSPKLRLRADYGHYLLAYADDRNAYRDRSDDTYSGYVFFQTTPKTALFVQGEYITIDYDEEVNSHQQNYYLGIQMQTSAKTRGRLKVGYGMQEYSADDDDAFLAEAQLDYIFTPKTSVYLRGTRRILESDVESDQDGAREILSHRVLSHRALLGYRQRLAAKWRGDANVFFNRSEYDGTVNIEGRDASDYYYDEFGGGATLGFSPLTWMNLSLGYEYRERDSTFDSEDYRSNTVFLRAAAAL